MITKYDVAAIVAIEQLDITRCKLSAPKQRRLFGYVPLGHRDCTFDSTDQGTVRIGRYTDGTNYGFKDYSYEEFAQAINEHKPLEAW